MSALRWRSIAMAVLGIGFGLAIGYAVGSLTLALILAAALGITLFLFCRRFPPE